MKYVFKKCWLLMVKIGVGRCFVVVHKDLLGLLQFGHFTFTYGNYRIGQGGYLMNLSHHSKRLPSH